MSLVDVALTYEIRSNDVAVTYGIRIRWVSASWSSGSVGHRVSHLSSLTELPQQGPDG